MHRVNLPTFLPSTSQALDIFDSLIRRASAWTVFIQACSRRKIEQMLFVGLNKKLYEGTFQGLSQFHKDSYVRLHFLQETACEKAGFWKAPALSCLLQKECSLRNHLRRNLRMPSSVCQDHLGFLIFSTCFTVSYSHRNWQLRMSQNMSVYVLVFKYYAEKLFFSGNI